MPELNRTILYKALRASTDLSAIIQDRLIEASAMGSELWPGVPERPFLTYRMHTGFPVGRRLGRREYSQFWMNDDPGDYEKIDQALEIVKAVIEAVPPQDSFLEARWIETGVDLEDKAMGTINRYIRFQITGTNR